MRFPCIPMETCLTKTEICCTLLPISVYEYDAPPILETDRLELHGNHSCSDEVSWFSYEERIRR